MKFNYNWLPLIKTKIKLFVKSLFKQTSAKNEKFTNSKQSTQENLARKHHYVPQFLLRKFSGDKKNINLIVLKNTDIKCGPIKGQCYEKYLHGKDGKLEKAFSILESDTASILLKIENDELLNQDDIFILKTFINYQLMRTTAATNSLEQTIDSLTKMIIGKDKSISKNDLDQLKIGLKHPFLFSLAQANKTVPLFLDLEIKILKNEREIDFVISDNPVILNNQFIEHHQVLSSREGSTGLAIKGLQIFFPISPKFAIFIYDPQVYRIGMQGKMTVNISKNDVKNLNRLQAVFANNCLYALNFSKIGITAAELTSFHKDRQQSKKQITKKVGTRRLSDNRTSELIHTIKIDYRKGIKFSFCQITDKHDYSKYSLAIPPIRSQQILDIHKSYSNFIDELINKKTK